MKSGGLKISLQKKKLEVIFCRENPNITGNCPLPGYADSNKLLSCKFGSGRFFGIIISSNNFGEFLSNFLILNERNLRNKEKYIGIGILNSFLKFPDF